MARVFPCTSYHCAYVQRKTRTVTKCRCNLSNIFAASFRFFLVQVESPRHIQTMDPRGIVCSIKHQLKRLFVKYYSNRNEKRSPVYLQTRSNYVCLGWDRFCHKVCSRYSSAYETHICPTKIHVTRQKLILIKLSKESVSYPPTLFK